MTGAAQHEIAQIGVLDAANSRLKVSDEKFEEATRLASAAGPREVLVQARGYIAASAQWRGDFRRSIVESRRAEAVAQDCHDGFYEIFALSFECLAQIGLGRYPEALEVIQRGLALSRERNNVWMEGRLTNSLGWLHQEVGDFRRARKLNEESAEMGRRGKIPNVEISALINVSFDELNFGDPRRALALMEDTLTKVDTVGFGVHRWRWLNHLSAYLAEALLAVGQPDRALVEAEQCLAKARATEAAKYIGNGHAIRGLIALAAGRWSQAEADLAAALAAAQRIEYPTLTWQAAHALALALRAQAEHARGGDVKAERAWQMLTLADATISGVPDRLPDHEMRRTFLGWGRVQAVRDDLKRLRRG